MTVIIYFSSSSENTHHFVKKLGLPAMRVPLNIDSSIRAEAPYILITPTYGGGYVSGSVPRQIIRFLNDPLNRSLLRGVIGSGNRSFGSSFCLAGKIISQKCRVPLLYRFELLGTKEDILQVHKGVLRFWQNKQSTS